MKIFHGECLAVMKTLPDNSVDSIVTDPPYGLEFMGKDWDAPWKSDRRQMFDGSLTDDRNSPFKRSKVRYGIGSSYGAGAEHMHAFQAWATEIFAEALRVLKPGGHLLSFSGSRTYHRMASAIEDAGFEIRDQIMWIYGSGFPKSLNISKALDKAAGAEREVIGPSNRHAGISKKDDTVGDYARFVSAGDVITAPATDAAKQWDGWGTSMKPAFEPVIVAAKPYTAEGEQGIIDANLLKLGARLWSLLLALTAEKSSTSNPSELGEALNIAQWTADEATNTLADLSVQMDTLQLELAINMSLSIVSSWHSILADLCCQRSMSTTETKSRTITDWKTLRFCLSQITPRTIIPAAMYQDGWIAHANNAERYFHAELSKLSAILELSAVESAIAQQADACHDVDANVKHEPVVVARKPLSEKTVAANVLQHGTGALNIDACRVPTEDKLAGGHASAGQQMSGGWDRPWMHDPEAVAANAERSKAAVAKAQELGRWPANVIHDGLPEDWARYFYCAKTSKKDRDEGLGGFDYGVVNDGNPTVFDNPYQRGKTERRNTHPCVKPTALMAYLCRLVTPPGGIVLDPFMGSGSTGKGAALEGFNFIGIEMEREYVEIAQARIAHVTQQPVTVVYASAPVAEGEEKAG